MRVIITGASGMIGRGVLLECLDHPKIIKILVIGRSPLNQNHTKLKELIHKDFSDFNEVKSELNNFDACFFCLGTSAAGMKENDYHKISYDFTISLATVLFELNPLMTFNYVSGEGTDSTENGRTMWARVKGKTENDLLKLGFRQTFMFRPGAIIPLRGIKSKTNLYQFFYTYFGWLLKIIKVIFPNSVCNTTQIGSAMINSAINGYQKQILKPIDIIILSK